MTFQRCLHVSDEDGVCGPDVADLMLASGEQFVWGSLGTAASFWGGLNRASIAVKSGRGYEVGIGFIEGIGEHMGQAVVGIQAMGVGAETGSPGLVFDGYIDAGAGAWKLAADALTFRTWFRKPGCFVAGTPVETPGGSVAIEFLEEGDVVAALDLETGERVWREVTGTTFIPDAGTIELDLEYEDVAGALLHSTIVVTEGHPLWSADADDWKNAANVEVGELLDTATGVARVVGLRLAGSKPVYNIEVEGEHNYFAGDAGLLVHNGGLDCGGIEPQYDAHVRAYRAQGVSKNAAMLRNGPNNTTVTVRTKAEANALPQEAFPGYQKIRGVGPQDASPLRRKTTMDRFKRGGAYHKDYAVDDTGRVRGHGAGNAHGDHPHINIKRLDGRKVIINISEG